MLLVLRLEISAHGAQFLRDGSCVSSRLAEGPAVGLDNSRPLLGLAHHSLALCLRLSDESLSFLLCLSHQPPPLCSRVRETEELLPPLHERVLFLVHLGALRRGFARRSASHLVDPVPSPVLTTSGAHNPLVPQLVGVASRVADQRSKITFSLFHLTDEF